MCLLKKALIVFAVLFVAANAGRVALRNGEVVCACTMNYDPVCATDGETYANLCSFECARDEAVEKGRSQIRLINERGECTR